jgi:rhomboid protease GluP
MVSLTHLGNFVEQDFRIEGHLTTGRIFLQGISQEGDGAEKDNSSPIMRALCRVMDLCLMDVSKPILPDCHHNEAERMPCTLCSEPYCTRCATEGVSTPPVCRNCLAQLAAEDEPAGLKEEPDTDPFRQAGKAPFTLLFCLLLGVLYLLSSFPVWTAARIIVLALVNLDVPALIEGHQYWRLITANLFHANIAHLGSNLFGLLIFGHFLEVQVGWRVLVFWMLLSLLGCDIASVFFGVNHSIGASGIAYGLQTAFIVLSGKVLIVNQVQKLGKTLQSLVGYLILIVILNSFNTDHINIHGHFGGAFAGLLCAISYPVSRPFSAKDFIPLALLFIVFVAVLGILL